MEGAAPLMDLPPSMILEQIVHPSREEMIGRTFRIAHLTSERGSRLNGKHCVVKGFDRNTMEARLHCKVEGEESGLKKLKATNLVSLQVTSALDHFMERSYPIPDQELVICLERSLDKHAGDTDRADLAHRRGLYRGLRNKLKDRSIDAPPLADSEYCFPCGAGGELLGDNAFAVAMNAMRPGCCGNGYVDMRHIDIGLKGDGHTVCAICSHVLAHDKDEVLVTLPCLHIFHENCILDWLESDLGQINWNCPSCRAVVPGEMSTYCINYNEQLQRRIDEYPLSGFCAKCMIWMMERNRNDPLPVI